MFFIIKEILLKHVICFLVCKTHLLSRGYFSRSTLILSKSVTTISQHVTARTVNVACFPNKKPAYRKKKNKEKIIHLKDVHKTIISGLIPRHYRNLRYTVIDKNTEIKNMKYLC